MNLSLTFDILIGLSFTYLVLSLLASEIQELIATVLQWRSKHLRNSIVDLLENQTKESSNNSFDETNSLVTKFYQNYLIESLNQKSKGRTKLEGPTYIPSRVFAAVLLEILSSENRLDPSNLEEIEQAIEQLKNEKLKNNLLGLLRQSKLNSDETKQKVKQFQREIEIWFDDVMDRTSGVYKRNAKGVALITGLAITFTINADALYMIDHLSKDPVLRSTTSQVAEQVASSNPEAISCLKTASSEIERFNCLETVKTDVKLALGLNEVSLLPVGWDLSNPFKRQFSSFRSIIKAIFGWTISGIAISMGASFWFNLLNKIINVRNAGRMPNVSNKN